MICFAAKGWVALVGEGRACHAVRSHQKCHHRYRCQLENYPRKYPDNAKRLTGAPTWRIMAASDFLCAAVTGALTGMDRWRPQVADVRRAESCFKSAVKLRLARRGS